VHDGAGVVLVTAWSPVRPESAPQVRRLIGGLLASRPEAGADLADRARWTARRADVFAEVADLHEADGDVVSAGEARAQAHAALQEAHLLSAQAVEQLRGETTAEAGARPPTLQELAATRAQDAVQRADRTDRHQVEQAHRAEWDDELAAGF